MKKRLLYIVLTLCVALALTACGAKDTGADSQPSASQPPASQPSPGQEASPSGGIDRYVFAFNGHIVAIDDNMADVLAALGEPQSYFEAASCAFEGLDKTYTYSGFVITTRPDGEQDFVNSVLLTDDSVVTPEGVYIGCTAEEVTAAYGEGEQTETVIRCTKGNTAMNFVLKNGSVISIEYLPA